jgi:hypothetical protein
LAGRARFVSIDAVLSSSATQLDMQVDGADDPALSRCERLSVLHAVQTDGIHSGCITTLRASGRTSSVASLLAIYHSTCQVMSGIGTPASGIRTLRTPAFGFSVVANNAIDFIAGTEATRGG